MRDGIRTVGWVVATAALVLWIGAGCENTNTPGESLAEADEHPHEDSEAAEHPHEGKEKSAEHPEEKKPEPAEEKEHPEEEKEGDAEHPDEASRSGEPVTLADVAEKIRNYVDAEAGESGRFAFRDEKADETLSLALDKIHRERLADLGEGQYFVCADFTTPEGKLYDLDFFVKRQGDGLQVTEVMLHKEAGTPRYTWYEENGIWKRRTVTSG